MKNSQSKINYFLCVSVCLLKQRWIFLVSSVVVFYLWMWGKIKWAWHTSSSPRKSKKCNFIDHWIGFPTSYLQESNKEAPEFMCVQYLSVGFKPKSKQHSSGNDLIRFLVLYWVRILNRKLSSFSSNIAPGFRRF